MIAEDFGPVYTRARAGGMVSRERRYDWSSKRTELQTLLQLAKLYYAQGQNPSAVPRGRDWYGEALSTMDTWFANKANPDPDSHYSVTISRWPT